MKLNRRRFLAASLAAAPGAALAQSAAMPVKRTPGELLRFGLITDVQYADAEPAGERHYRLSVDKLKAAVADLTPRGLPFTLHLGDLIDRDLKSFDTILPLLPALGHPVHHLIGNHEYTVREEDKARVVQKLGMPHDYYTFRREGVRFLMLDTNALSLYKHPAGTPAAKRSEAAYAKALADADRGAKPWNGGVDDVQMEWIERELTGATAAGEIVLVCAHHPLLPAETHQTWNPDSLLGLLSRHRCVKAWLNGHNHAGDYAEHEGIHFITFRSVLQHPGVNAWSVVTVRRDGMSIEGKGREVSRDLKFRA